MRSEVPLKGYETAPATADGGTEEDAPCGCPVTYGITRHLRGTCTDPEMIRLDWYAE
jgi:hypothetical protein